jgi:hypothetical protein
VTATADRQYSSNDCIHVLKHLPAPVETLPHAVTQEDRFTMQEGGHRG